VLVRLLTLLVAVAVFVIAVIEGGLVVLVPRVAVV
jgi:hypothetical protein